MDLVINTIKFIAGSAVDVLPIAVFLFAFQWLVIGGKLPNSGRIVVGFVFVVIGLGLFLEGLEQTLFPLGRLMAAQLTDPSFLLESAGRIAGELTWQDFYWVYIFAAAIGFSTTMAEPSLIAVSMKANSVSAGAIGVLGLRIAVAIGVGIGVSLGNRNAVGVNRRSGAHIHVPARSDDAVKSLAIDNQVADDREGIGPEWLDPNRVIVRKLAHVQLAGRHTAVLTVRNAVDGQRTGSANPLAAVMIEMNRLLATFHQALVNNI